MNRIFAFLARGAGSLFVRVGFGVSSKFPCDDELRLRVIFGELSLAEAESRAGHFLGGCDVPNLKNQVRCDEKNCRFPDEIRNGVHLATPIAVCSRAQPRNVRSHLPNEQKLLWPYALSASPVF